jgi:hypothetical protein
MPASRCFSAPWRAEKIPAGYVVRDANGYALAYVYSQPNEAETCQAKVLTTEEARHIAIGIARLPELTALEVLLETETKPTAETIAKELTAPELALLFCIVTGAEWGKAGITVETVRVMAIKGLIEPDRVGRLTLTKQGRAVLAALRKDRHD